jgi:hypothetical protein
VHTLLIYRNQDEIVLVTLQPDFMSRDMDGQMRRLAYVDRRVQSFPHLRASDLPAATAMLDIQPARADCSYVSVDDDVLRHLREVEMERSAAVALEGASAHLAVKEMDAAIAAIPAYLAAERLRRRHSELDQPVGALLDRYADWASPGSLDLLEESHADLAARIRAAARVLERYSTAPTDVESAEPAGGPDTTAPDPSEPSDIRRKFYDRPRAG